MKISDEISKMLLWFQSVDSVEPRYYEFLDKNSNRVFLVLNLGHCGIWIKPGKQSGRTEIITCAGDIEVLGTPVEVREVLIGD